MTTLETEQDRINQRQVIDRVIRECWAGKRMAIGTHTFAKVDYLVSDLSGELQCMVDVKCRTQTRMRLEPFGIVERASKIPEYKKIEDYFKVSVFYIYRFACGELWVSRITDHIDLPQEPCPQRRDGRNHSTDNYMAVTLRFGEHLHKILDAPSSMSRLGVNSIHE